MAQIDMRGLMDVQRDIDAVVELTGNCGKDVRRVLERHFPKGFYDAVLKAPDWMSTFQFACYIRESVNDGCRMANEAARHRNEPLSFSVDVEESWKEYRLHIEMRPIPAGVKDRQAMLKNISFALGRLIAALDLTVRELPWERFFTALYADEPSEDTEGNREKVIEQFKAIISFDYRQILELPASVIILAGWLEDGVYDALRLFSAERERQLQLAAA